MSVGEILFGFTFVILLGIIAAVQVLTYLEKTKSEDYDYD